MSVITPAVQDDRPSSPDHAIVRKLARKFDIPREYDLEKWWCEVKNKVALDEAFEASLETRGDRAQELVQIAKTMRVMSGKLENKHLDTISLQLRWNLLANRPDKTKGVRTQVLDEMTDLKMAEMLQAIKNMTLLAEDTATWLTNVGEAWPTSSRKTVRYQNAALQAATLWEELGRPLSLDKKSRLLNFIGEVFKALGLKERKNLAREVGRWLRLKPARTTQVKK
jgi:hypothetical protein